MIMADDLGQKVHFQGPGQWRTQAAKAQRGTQPPDAALEVTVNEASRSDGAEEPEEPSPAS